MRTGHATASFYSAVAVFVFAFVGLAISSYPYLVPWSLTLWEAAASPAAQKFIFIGIAILLGGGALLGWLGAWISANKHLRSIEPRA